MPLSVAISVKYRGFTIVPTKGIPGNGRLVAGIQLRNGFMVSAGKNASVWPGDYGFETVSKAKMAIDVYLAVERDADLFMEIMEPYDAWPGEISMIPGGSSAPNVVLTKGRFVSEIQAGRVAAVSIQPRNISFAQFAGLRRLISANPSMGLTIFSLGLVLPQTLK